MASISPINTNSPLGKMYAAHLLRRTTFGPTAKEIDQYAALTLDQALTNILAEKEPPVPPVSPATGQPFVNTPDGNDEESQNYVLDWWVDLTIKNEPSIYERMVWFYHSHYTTIRDRVNNGSFIYNQMALFRYHAMGNFKDLSKLMIYDNAMLRHLDGWQNTYQRPNENFAREFLELYTIGKGDQRGPDDYTNYTELDVQEGARVLSGFVMDNDLATIDEITGIPTGKIRGDGPTANWHDSGEKTFSQAFNAATVRPAEVVDGFATREAFDQEINDFMNMIFDQLETARHFCRKLYRFFVYYDITDEIENDIIAPLAQTLYDNEYNIKPVLEQLFRSQHFYDADNGTETDDNRSALIKSPLELTVGAMRFFTIELPDETSSLETRYAALGNLIFRKMEDQGMQLYQPPEVAGYKAYHQAPIFNRNWITGDNLLNRYTFSTDILTGVNGQVNEQDVELYKADLLKYVQDNSVNVNSPEDIVRHFVDYMLPEAITQERFDFFKSKLLLEVEEQFWVETVINAENFVLLYHLEGLINCLMQSPEYQLF